jgi:hypothetical protein
MPKPQSNRLPDPMSGVVDRLLAQLPGLQVEPSSSASSRLGNGSLGPVHVVPLPSEDLLGPRSRLTLALALGTMMAWWPYSRTCGVPLLGYLGAVLAVIVGGSWAAASAWRHRTGLVHLLSLVLVLYGVMLGAAELLPRTGYAVDQANWVCEDAPLPPTQVTAFHSL